MHNGARFYRCDLQVHSPRDPQWKGGSRPVSEDERRAWAQRLIQACRREGLGALALADHHDTAMFRYVREAAEAEQDDQGQAVAADQRIIVFPGMELTLSLPCQALVIFDATLPLESLDQLPGILGYEQAAPEAERSHQAQKLSLNHPNDVMDRLEGISYLAGRFIVLPHVAENGHQTLIRRGFDSHYREFRGVGGYTDGAIPPVGTGARTILDGQNKAYGRKPLGVFQTSDCRKGDFSGLGSSSTWVKWSKPTAEALRQSCLARHSRISQTEPPLPSSAITRVEITVSRFLGKLNLFLSPQYNTLIGGRGTGKSTLLEYIRWAMCIPPVRTPDDTDQVLEFERRSKALIEKTLADVKGAVRVTTTLNGVPHIVERRSSGNGDRLMLKIGADEFRPVDEEEVRRLIPIEAYSQKQLSSVGGRPADVLRFVLAAVETDVGRIEDQIASASDEIRAAYGRLRIAERASEEAARLASEKDSLLQQKSELEKQYSGIDPADAQVLRSADGYASEIAQLDRWTLETTEAEVALRRARAELKEQPSSFEPKTDVPDKELMSSLRSTLDAFYTSLREQVDSAMALFSGEAMERFRQDSREIRQKVDAARSLFKDARARAHAHEKAIKEVETISKRISEIDGRLNALGREVSSAEAAELDYGTSTNAWMQAVHARGALTARRAQLVETRSRNLVRAEVVVAGDLKAPVNVLAEVSRGSRVRSDKFSDLHEYLVEQDKPLESWLRAVDELRGVMGHESDDSTLPPCPVLHAAGLTDKELKAIATRLDDDAWLRVRLALPLDSVKFEYKSREGEYLDFSQASAGQRATALMRVLLADEGAPLIIDQPEDDLDNRIIHEIASDIWGAKGRRQLIFASHNANLVVNGDADLVVVFDYSVQGEQTAGHIVQTGSIDDRNVCAAITEIMEGGREAFQLRRDKYSF